MTRYISFILLCTMPFLSTAAQEKETIKSLISSVFNKRQEKSASPEAPTKTDTQATAQPQSQTTNPPSGRMVKVRLTGSLTEPVQMHLPTGQTETVTTLPYDFKVPKSALPANLTFESPSYEYNPITINKKEIDKDTGHTYVLKKQKRQMDMAGGTPTIIQQTVVQQQGGRTSNAPIPSSDVDQNIPHTSTVNGNTFAIIIANEKYDREAEVQFASNDGQMFKRYCEETLGIPNENVHYRENATLNNIIAEVDWLKKVCSVFGEEARVLFYYAGHGIPDEASKDAYLLPVDGMGSNVATGYKLSSLYETLGQMKAQNITVFLDACFSGSQRDDKFLVSARGVSIKAKPAAPQGAMVVVTAAQGDETAYPYKEKGHGLFTYFLLKKLQESKGDCTMQELTDYVKSQVSKRAIIVNEKPQTPTISYSAAMGEKWKSIKLK